MQLQQNFKSALPLLQVGQEVHVHTGTWDFDEQDLQLLESKAFEHQPAERCETAEAGMSACLSLV